MDCQMNKYESDQVAPGCTSVGWSSSRNIRKDCRSHHLTGLKLGYFWVIRFGIATLCHRYFYRYLPGFADFQISPLLGTVVKPRIGSQMVHRNGGFWVHGRQQKVVCAQLHLRNQWFMHLRNEWFIIMRYTSWKCSPRVYVPTCGGL